MALKCKDVFIVGAKRTPFTVFGGALRGAPAAEVFAAAARGALRAACLPPQAVDNTTVGSVHFLSQCDGGKIARHCGLHSGVPAARPALAVSKGAATGLQAIVTSAVDILTGSAKIILTGGTEIMSALPLLVRNARFGLALGAPRRLEDLVAEHHMRAPEHPERRALEELARRYGITRRHADEYTIQSHLKCTAGHAGKVFEDELISLKVNVEKKEVEIKKDDKPNSKITLEDISALPPAVPGVSGVPGVPGVSGVPGGLGVPGGCALSAETAVTAGNLASPADGAVALLVASADAAAEYGLRPLARVAGWACAGAGAGAGAEAGDAPLAAARAVQALLRALRIEVQHVDAFELDESSAVQSIATAAELGVRRGRGLLNRHGGALALGAPAAASAARLAAHLAHRISRGEVRRGIAASSCAGGQGVALMLEKV